jgi:uncharacterized protein (DUF58 family)
MKFASRPEPPARRPAPWPNRLPPPAPRRSSTLAIWRAWRAWSFWPVASSTDCLSGRHRSKLKGGSAEFTEHRGYVPGDEIRLIDWKVFGKSDRYYIRQYIEQTCLQVVVALDASGSMAVRAGVGGTKFHYARAVAACLTRLVLRQSDSAGLAVFGGRRCGTYVPPRANPGHFQAHSPTAGEARFPAGEAALAAGLDRAGPAHPAPGPDRAVERLFRRTASPAERLSGTSGRAGTRSSCCTPWRGRN